MAYKRNCYTCGSEYEYCIKCGEFAAQPKWRQMWDTEECKDLWNAISGYNMGIIGVDGIKEVISKYGITDYKKYNKNIEEKLNEIFPKQKKIKKKYMDIKLDKVIESTTLDDSSSDGISE